MVSLDFSEDKFFIYATHKSLGLLVLLLTCLRIIWHILTRKPKPLSSHHASERFAAHIAHIFLYIALFVMPLSGWIMSSAGDFSIQFFGLDLPDIAKKDETLFKNARNAHATIALILVFVVGLHMLGAFKHHFIDHDATLQRMSHMSLGSFGGAVLAFIILVLYAPAAFYALQKLNIDKPEHKYEVVQTDNAPGALSGNWQVDLQNSTISFEATQYGQTFEGHFKIRGGDIVFDENRLDQSKTSVEIDIASITTGSQDRDVQARSDDWFAVKNYPVAFFTADIFEKTADNHFLAKGTLTLRGVTVPLDLPFTLHIKDERAEMHAALTLNRLDFDIGQGEWQSTDVIGNKVKLNITVHAQQK